MLQSKKPKQKRSHSDLRELHKSKSCQPLTGKALATAAPVAALVAVSGCSNGSGVVAMFAGRFCCISCKQNQQTKQLQWN